MGGLTHQWDYYSQLNDVCEHGFYCAQPEFSSFCSGFGVVQYRSCSQKPFGCWSWVIAGRAGGKISPEIMTDWGGRWEFFCYLVISDYSAVMGD